MTNPDTKEEDSDFEKEKNKAAWNIMRTSWYTQGGALCVICKNT